MPKPVGKVHKTRPLTLHRRVGSAENEHESFVMLICEPLGTPMVVAKDGRCFALSWHDTLDLTREAFTNQPGVDQ